MAEYMLVKICLLIAFFAIMISVGLYARKKVKTIGDFVLGGRSIGPWFSAFAYGTSYFSAVVFIGYAGQFGWNFGVSAIWIGLGNAFIGSMMAWMILGRRTRLMTRYLSASTMPDYFEKRYDSRMIRLVASVIIFVFLVPYTASIYKGLSTLFSMAFGIDYRWCIVGMAVLTGVYVVLGGYMATSINDFIQGLIMLFGIIAVIATVIAGKGGFMAALTELSQTPSFSAASPGLQGAYTSILGPDPLSLLSVIILTSLGTWGLPQMVHKFYTIKDERSIKTGTVISTIFALVVAGGSYFLGGFGRIFVAANADGSPAVPFDSIVPNMLNSALPDALIGLVIVLVFSASMSTLASLVMVSSSTLTLDFLKGYCFKRMSQKTSMVMIRVFCVVFIVVSVLLALNPNSLVSSLMGISWGALAGSFLAPLLYGLYWKRTTRAAVWTSFVIGPAITIVNLIYPFTTPIAAGAIAMVAGMILIPIVSLMSKKLPAEHVNSIFLCLEGKVTVHSKYALEDSDD